MAFALRRCFAQTYSKLTIFPSTSLSQGFTKSRFCFGSSSKFIKFRAPSANRYTSKLIACLTLGLGGSAIYLYNTQQHLRQDFLVVHAGSDGYPCGDKKRGKLKVSSPCGGRKKKVEPQPNVISCMKKYSLFLWISLEADADPCAVACAAAQIEEAIAATRGYDCDVDDEVLAGVGFGPNFLRQNCMSPAKNFCYHTRKGKLGEMPSSNGDIFVHAKADSLGQLFDFCKTYLHNFPSDCVCEFEDLYGFSFRGNRDISGFAINMTNRGKEEGLREVALEEDTAGSYALAQKWVHDLCVLEEDSSTLEGYIGRKMENREEIRNRAVSSHVTRMSGNTEPGSWPKYEVVQQSMSYGSMSERAGLFFLGFAKDPCTFDCMLDRMVGANCEDNEHDDVMRMSKNVKGTYFYFPGVKEIESLKSSS